MLYMHMLCTRPVHLWGLNKALKIGHYQNTSVPQVE